MEDSQHPEPILDFQRVYCTVCLFLQSKLSEICNEKQSEGTLCHLPHIPTQGNSKKGVQKPSKRTPKHSCGRSEHTPKKPPKPITLKNHFLRRSPTGGFEVFLPWDLEMGPRLYIDIFSFFFVLFCVFIYIYIYCFFLLPTR